MRVIFLFRLVIIKGEEQKVWFLCRLLPSHSEAEASPFAPASNQDLGPDLDLSSARAAELILRLCWKLDFEAERAVILENGVI